MCSIAPFGAKPDVALNGFLSVNAPSVRHNEKTSLVAGFVSIGFYLFFMVARDRIELPTRGFSVLTRLAYIYIFQQFTRMPVAQSAPQI